jgi:hypothetical protein
MVYKQLLSVSRSSTGGPFYRRAEIEVHLRRRTHMMAVDTRIRTSFPSRRKASHIRNCVENEIAFAKSVMYHFVANDDIVIKFLSYSSPPILTSISMQCVKCGREDKQLGLTKTSVTSGMSNSTSFS